MSFRNTSIVAPFKDKPHICIRQGYWRVSPLFKPHYGERGVKWNEAHKLTRRLNAQRGNHAY